MTQAPVPPLPIFIDSANIKFMSTILPTCISFGSSKLEPGQKLLVISMREVIREILPEQNLSKNELYHRLVSVFLNTPLPVWVVELGDVSKENRESTLDKLVLQNEELIHIVSLPNS